MKPRGTKAQVVALARQLHWDVSTRRHFTTEWLSEITDATGRHMMQAMSISLPEVYGELAVRLRVLVARTT